MKRRYCVVLSFIIILLLFRPVVVRAQEPTPATLPVKGGVPTALDLTESKSFKTEDERGRSTFFDFLQFTFTGILTAPKQFKLANIGWIAEMFKNADPAKTPALIQKNRPPDATLAPQHFSGKTRICVTDPQTGELKERVGNELFKTEQLPWLSIMDKYLKSFASYTTRFSLSLKDQRFEEPTQDLAEGFALPCTAEARGKPQVAAAIAGEGTNSFIGPEFNILNILVSITRAIIQGLASSTVTAPAKAVITVNKPFADTDFCLLSNCQYDNVTIAEKPKEEVNRFVASGGIVKAMAPSVHDPTKGERHGSISNTFQKQGLGSHDGPTNINLNDPYSKATLNSVNYLRCALSDTTHQTPDMDCPNAGKAVDVPDEIIAFVDATNPHPEGILGEGFLKKYDPNLVNIALTSEQRALMLERIQFLIDKYVKTNIWPKSQLGDTNAQSAIAAASQKYKINEAFLYALWIEETHASSVGTYPFGCGHATKFQDSLNCVTTNPVVQTYLKTKSFPQVMCMYADGNYPCTFETHPDFVRNWSYYYDFFTLPPK